jgi:hypothetical protein
LERLLAALDRPTLGPRRPPIAVESEEDPAFARAHAALNACPLPGVVLLAGKAQATAQARRRPPVLDKLVRQLGLQEIGASAS